MDLSMVNKILIIISVFFFGIVLFEIFFYIKLINDKTTPINEYIPTPREMKYQGMNNGVMELKDGKKINDIFDDTYYLLSLKVVTNARFTVEYGGVLKKVQLDFPDSRNTNTIIPLLVVITPIDKTAKDFEVGFTQEDLNKAIIKDNIGKQINYKQLKVGQTIFIKMNYDFLKNIEPPIEMAVTYPKK
jgi:hypothetical protein